MDVEDLALNPAELVQERERREIHAAHARWAESDQAKQLLMPYRHGRYAAIEPGFEFKPGFIYTQVRAISARINQNYDAWPSEELKKSFRTFIGKPIFVNHQNFDHRKARGKVVAARYVDAGDDRYVDTVMEVDAQRFPKLAHELKTGGLDSVSMGVEAGFTKCSICDNKAVDVPDFCAHVKYHKGSTLPHAKTGKPTLVYENCYKLAFFELSYVFDPADETAVVSRVIAASNKKAQAEEEPMPDEIVEGQMPTGQMPTARRRRAETYHGEGDVEKKSGPFLGEDGSFPVGTQKDKNDAKDVCNFPSVRSKNPEECAKADKLSRVEARINRLAYGEVEAPEDVDTLRDESEDDNDDFKHYVESPKELQQPNLDRTQQLDRTQESEGLDTPRRVEQVEDVGGHLMGQEPRNSDRRDIEEIKLMAHTLVDPRTGKRYVAADEDEQGPPPDFGGEDEAGDDDDSYMEGDDSSDDDSGGDDLSGKSDAELLAEAEEDLGRAEAEMGSEDDGGDEGDWGSDDSGDDAADDFSGDDDLDDAGGTPDEDVPPFGRDEDEDSGPPREGRRRNRKAKKGRQPMGLQARNRVATAGRRRHYADDQGYTDGGPYGENDQGEQEDVFISQTPGTEPVAAPTPGDDTISNTENNLVEARLRRRIQQRNAELKRDIIAYEQITGRRVANRRYAEDDNLPNLPDQSTGGTETPDQVDPTVDDPAGEDLTGDNFTSVALDGGSGAETQPKDASVRAFKAFDNWLARTTGRTAAQHGNPNFIRRSAAHYCQAAGVPVESLFPKLGSVLRQARKNERSGSMRRRADEKLDVAAPQDRIDVEAPVSDVTDQEAQASQYSLSDFGDNAGDNVADPELSPDSQIWAPGEGDSAAGSNRESNRKASGIAAVRYAEAFIKAGLAPDTPEEKWKIAGLAQNMRHAQIVDRTNLLDAVNQVNRARTARRTAATNGSRIPQGLTQRQLTAGSRSAAANDPSSDFALFMKG
jgi:hypothetical protein